MKSADSCVNCNDDIDTNVYRYSFQNYGFPLCYACQKTLKNKIDETTDETIRLYFSLRKRGVPAQLEKNDGYKTIDIAVVAAKVNIEVDGTHHNYSYQQALADLKRTYYAFQKRILDTTNTQLFDKEQSGRDSRLCHGIPQHQPEKEKKRLGKFFN